VEHGLSSVGGADKLDTRSQNKTREKRGIGRLVIFLIKFRRGGAGCRRWEAADQIVGGDGGKLSKKQKGKKASKGGNQTNW